MVAISAGRVSPSVCPPVADDVGPDEALLVVCAAGFDVVCAGEDTLASAVVEASRCWHSKLSKALFRLRPLHGPEVSILSLQPLSLSADRNCQSIRGLLYAHPPSAMER